MMSAFSVGRYSVASVCTNCSATTTAMAVRYGGRQVRRSRISNWSPLGRTTPGCLWSRPATYLDAGLTAARISPGREGRGMPVVLGDDGLQVQGDHLAVGDYHPTVDHCVPGALWGAEDGRGQQRGRVVAGRAVDAQTDGNAGGQVVLDRGDA